jgi:hypothetical protein
MFFPTSMTSLMVTFGPFLSLIFSQIFSKNPSQLPVMCSPVVCLVTMFLPHIVNKILWTKAWYMSFLVLWRIFLLHKTEFNMPITLLPSLILFYSIDMIK